MLNYVDFSGKPFHFIGIGGIGMSALAYILAKRKLPVSGSDIRHSYITQRLEAIGTHIFGEQDALNLEFFLSEAERDFVGVPTATLSSNSIPVLIPENPIEKLIDKTKRKLSCIKENQIK